MGNVTALFMDMITEKSGEARRAWAARRVTCRSFQLRQGQAPAPRKKL